MLQLSGKRFIQTHPHTGRTFVTGDTFTILDVWQCSDAYANALNYGSQWVNDSGICWNPGSFRNNGPTVTCQNMHHEPVVGMSGGPSTLNSVNQPNGYRYIVDRFVDYVADYGGELNSQHDSFALGLDFRFLSIAEFSTARQSQGAFDGVGARAQRLTISVNERSNPAQVGLQYLVDIFFDYQYYLTKFPGTPFFPWAIDLAAQDTPFEQSGQINQLLILDKFDAAIRKVGSAAMTLQARYELPLRPNGNNWDAAASQSEVFDWNSCDLITHPNSGADCQSWGLLAITMTNFRSSTYTAPTGALGTNGRVQTAFPLTTDAVMGQNLGFSTFDDLYFKGRAAIGVSWPSVCLGRRSFGGLNRILVGDFARFQTVNSGTIEWAYDDHASQILEIRCQLPSGATRFTLHALVRYIAGVGIHTIKFELIRDFDTAPFQATQTLYSATFTSNFGPSWVWVDGALSTNMLPNQGQVEHVRLKITVTKSVPRTTNYGYTIYPPDTNPPQPCSGPSAYDGVGACYLAFR